MDIVLAEQTPVQRGACERSVTPVTRTKIATVD